jgi:hypothetical protein
MSKNNLFDRQAFECYVCDKSYCNSGTFDQHMKSKKHMANYLKKCKVQEEYKMLDNESVSANSFDLTSAEDEDLNC